MIIIVVGVIMAIIVEVILPDGININYDKNIYNNRDHELKTVLMMIT